MNALLVTPEEEVILLERMYRPYAPLPGAMPLMSRTELQICQPAGLRIVEANPANPAAMALAHERAAYRRLQWEIGRGLVMVCIVLVALTIKAAFDHETVLKFALGLLASTCVPLYMMAIPAGSEVR